MKPKQYLRFIKKTTKELAEQIGYTRQHLSQVFNGKAPCGSKLAHKIDEWSDHAITWVEMMSIYKKK
jgi:hypothetical protein